MENKKIKCKDCGIEFDFTVGEQKFFAEKGFSDPVRCKDCRSKKKNNQTTTNTGMSEDEIERILKSWRENTVKF